MATVLELNYGSAGRALGKFVEKVVGDSLIKLTREWVSQFSVSPRSILLFILIHCSFVDASDLSISKNHVYGMSSGAALLMDIHLPQPALAKGIGIVMVPGSGWYAEDDYDTPGLKEMNSGWIPGDTLAKSMVARLVGAGYTVFVPNHRAAPKHRYPTAVNDIAQAVSYIRKRAAQYQIDSEFIGGVGTSSGGTLLSLLGVNNNLPADSRLQAVVTLGSPMDMVTFYYTSAMAAGTATSYMGRAINFLPDDHSDVLLYRDASPTEHISLGDAPHLLIHGTQDELVPIDQSVTAQKQFTKAGVGATLLKVPEGKHSENLLGENDYWLSEMVNWLDQLQ